MPTPPTEIYTLSLHDALPIFAIVVIPSASISSAQKSRDRLCCQQRSEEHTSELQSRSDLVCRLPPEKKKKIRSNTQSNPAILRPQQHSCLGLDKRPPHLRSQR